MAHKAQHSKGKSAPRSSRRHIDAVETGATPAAASSVSPSPAVAPRVAIAPRGAAASAFATSYPYIKKELIKIAVVTVAVIVVLVLVSLFLR